MAEQDPAEQQPGQYQAQGYGHAGAPLPAQQPDPSGQAWGQQAYASQGYLPYLLKTVIYHKLHFKTTLSHGNSECIPAWSLVAGF